MLYIFANGFAEDIQDDLTNDEKEYAKEDITERPAVFKCADDQYYLADDVDEEEDGVDNVCNNKDGNGILRV